MTGDQPEDPLGCRALGEDDAGCADTERIERGKVTRVTEEQLRHGQHQVVLTDVEHPAGVPVEAQQRAVGGVHARLGFTGAARRELPDGDVVACRRRRLQGFRGLADEGVEAPLAGAEIVRRDADDEQVARVGAPGRRLSHRLERDAVHDDDLGFGVVQVVGVVLGLQIRVDLGGHRTDLLRRIPRGHEIHAVAQRQQHAVLPPHAELLQHVAHLVGQRGELGVGRGPVIRDERRAVASTLLEVAIHEPAGHVEPLGDVPVPQHDAAPQPRIATARTTSTNMSVSVASVASPSSAVAPAGAPQ